MASQEHIAAVAKLVREMPRNPLVIDVERTLKADLDARYALALSNAQSNQLDATKANKQPFDKKAYQRDLMRKRRAAKKAAAK